MTNQTIPRPEYPRPQMVRAEWLNLNGTWKFETDSGKIGRERCLPESRLSGVKSLDFMESVWYRRTVALPDGWLAPGRRVLLHIGACDYRTEVWVGGRSAGIHIGEYVSFSMDITALVTEGENLLVICAEDDLRSGNQPAGKQCPSYTPYGALYTRTTGIWQTVWRECVPDAYIRETAYTPCLETQSLTIEVDCPQAHGLVLQAQAFFEGRPVGVSCATVAGHRVRLTLPLEELHLWSPQSPALYDLTLILGEDRADSYFGMREAVYHSILRTLPP